jgi:hypothetical protein
MITKGYTPVPNSFSATVNTLDITNREKFLIKVIGEEVYRFPEGRESLSEELSSRFLERITGIKRNHISVMLNKFQDRGYIRYIKSHVKGKGSLIVLTLGTVSGHDNSELGTVSVPNQKILFKKKDLDPKDSSLNIPEEEIPEEKISTKEKPIENSSLVSLPVTESSCVEESNSNDLVQLHSAGELTPSEKALNIGKSILKKKNFSQEEATVIIDRIIAIMEGKEIHNRDRYFIASCNREERKTTVKTTANAIHNTTNTTIHNTTTRTITVREKTAPTAPPVEQATSAVELLERIQRIAPAQLYEVIMTVDNDRKIQRGLSFLPGELKKEALAGLYISEFKKRFPEVKL